MMWRMNLGDGAVITQDGDSALSYEIVADCAVEFSHISPPDEILRYSRDSNLLSKLASVFLDNINQEHQFTPYTSSSFLDQYPYQSIDETFLHTAILATGAAFLASRDPNMAKVGEDFAKYAEKLVFDCCRYRPTLSVIQGMCILSFRSLSIGKDHLGWMFISMAGGLCVHLRLHVLALDECAGRALKPTSPEIRTFWIFYFVDVSANTILGRNCALPWRRVNVPEFHTTLNAETADLAELSFAWQSQLWYTHAEAMDQIFAPSFEKLAMAQQIRLLVSTLEQLNTFFRSKPHRLHINNDAPKPIVFFHLQYHMAIMIIISSFLRSFTSSDTPGISEAESNSSLLVLRSITSAASETIRLCRLYRDKYTFTMAHPIIVHHLLSAILVHLMNATSSDITLRRQSSRWLRTGMGLMDELRETWPTRVNKCIRVVRVLAQKWGAVGALPMAFAAPVELSAQERESPRQDASFSSRLNCPAPTSVEVYDGHDGTPFNGHAWQTGEMSSVSELLGAFGSLSSLPDLGWLYEGQEFDTSGT
ncbi:hypothetical protein K456DRAFT_1899018 [Colletotrichum gloeosporioides 23]|nr:hypothetical protein K456DRAFT_1899018 [Colletotrichum gloeosporioides 23]